MKTKKPNTVDQFRFPKSSGFALLLCLFIHIVGCGGPPANETSQQKNSGDANRASESTDRPSIGQNEQDLSADTIGAGLDANDPRILALLEWMATNGVVLEHVEGAGQISAYRLVSPKLEQDYYIEFSIRSFPAWATESQMRKALAGINLAYQLNPDARLAMSYGGTVGKQPDSKLPMSDDELPRLEGKPVTKTVEELFSEYRPLAVKETDVDSKEPR